MPLKVLTNGIIFFKVIYRENVQTKAGRMIFKMVAKGILKQNGTGKCNILISSSNSAFLGRANFTISLHYVQLDCTANKVLRNTVPQTKNVPTVRRVA